MSDYEQLVNSGTDCDNNEKAQHKNTKRRHKPKVGERDDFTGMTLNMVGKLDIREMFIIWIAFLFVHTELFVEQVLKRFKGATNSDNTMTMKGTLIASIIMMTVVILCAIVF